MRDKNYALEASLDFGSICGLEEQLQCFGQIAPCFFDSAALAGDVQFGTEGNITVALAFDDGHKL